MKKNISKIVLSICLVFVFKLTNAQQATGSFISMDGGLEGQSVGTLSSTTSSSKPLSTWSKSSSTGKGTVRNIIGIGGRTGDKYLTVNDTAKTNFSANVLSPTASTGAIIGGVSYIIQFYYRASDTANFPNTQISVGLSNSYGKACIVKPWTKNIDSTNTKYSN